MNKATKKFRIREASVKDENIFDLFVFAIGYESRSTFFIKKLENHAARKIGLAFTERKVGKFDENYQWCLDNKIETINYSHEAFLKVWIDILNSLDHQQDITIGIDISSMTRKMIAQLVLGLYRFDTNNLLKIRFIYSPSTYSPLPLEEYPVTVSQPVIPELAGWTDRPSLPTAAVIGLGYEKGQALGTLEYLEPAESWLLSPVGKYSEFDRDVTEANRELLDFVDSKYQFNYRLDSPFETFCKLESLIYGLHQNYRPILVPFGPKIFALLTILLGFIYYPHISVWRVSGDQDGCPADRVADGTTIQIDLEISSNS